MPPRSVALERLTYTLTAPILAAAPNLTGPFAHDANLAVLAAGGLATAGAVVAARSHEGVGRKIMRLSPAIAAALVELIGLKTHGYKLDAGLVAAWLSAGWVVSPWSRHARRYLPAIANTPTRAQIAATVTAAAPTVIPTVPAAPSPVNDGASTYTRQVRVLWERAGNPGRTIVVKADPHDGVPRDCTLLLRAAEAGRPISGLTKVAVAAALGAGIDEDDIHFMPVIKQSGREGGPGWLEVNVVPDETARRRKTPTDAERWADKIGNESGAIPGSTFLKRIRDDERGVDLWLARMADPDADPKIDEKKLAKALGANYDDGRVFADVEAIQILVSVWDTSPLAKIYPATRELLTPDTEGRWVVGYLGNGQPARNRVYSDRGAAHGLIVAPSGGGKTQLIALFVAADANYGAVIWAAAEAVDEKIATLGKYTDRQGFGALYMLRLLRAADALMDIRAQMPWADGQLHDYDPRLPGCPYAPLSGYLDEFLSAARHEKYGDEIIDLAERISVKGRKYAVGEKVAGQSVFVQDGFTQLLKDNLRELSIPVVLKLAPKKVGGMFRDLGVSDEHIPEPLPRSFSPAGTGRLERIMNGEPEPPASSNTGGVGWIIEHTRPEVLRTLFMDFSQDIAPLFPEQVTHLTDHEIRELDKRGLWGDWNRPDDEDDDGPDLDDWGNDTPYKQTPTEAAITDPLQALNAINNLTNA